jgi:hypothetical protein
VHALLNKTLPPALAHISSLKAVTSLKLDPAAAAISRAGSHAAAGPGPGSRSSSCDVAVFQCPVTGLEMNGRFPFVIHRWVHWFQWSCSLFLKLVLSVSVGMCCPLAAQLRAGR